MQQNINRYDIGDILSEYIKLDKKYLSIQQSMSVGALDKQKININI